MVTSQKVSRLTSPSPLRSLGSADKDDGMGVASRKITEVGSVRVDKGKEWVLETDGVNLRTVMCLDVTLRVLEQLCRDLQRSGN